MSVSSTKVNEPTKSWGYSTHSGETTSVSLPVLRWKADFAKKSQTASEVVYLNTTTPADQVESIRFAINDVKNVYAGEKDIDPTMYAPVKKGKSLVCSVKDTLRVTLDNGDVIDYPVSSHFVVKFPVSANIAAAEIDTIVKRMAGLHYNYIAGDSGNVVADQFDQLMRGAIDIANSSVI